jgi:competence protein ComEA
MAKLLGRTGSDRPVDVDAARRRLALLATELGGSGANAAEDDDGTGAGAAAGIGGAARERPVQAAAAPGRHRAEPGWRSAHSSAGGRSVTSQHVTVIAMVLVVLMAAGSWWMLSGRPQARAVPPVSHTTMSSPSDDGAIEPRADGDREERTSGADAQPAGGEEPAFVVVDVAGRVLRPGLVTLPVGARVADALKRAGGARPRVDLTSLNLARPLVDGEQLLVGVPIVGPAAVPGAGAPSASAPPTTTAPTLVDLNTATLEQLDTLPGVGPVTGQAILDWRAANGAFTSVDELLEVDGIGDATLADLRDLVTV